MSNTPVVTEKSALSISTVYACVRVLAEGIATLPWHSYKHISEGREVDVNHPNYALLRLSPNPHMTSFMFRELMVKNVALRGNFFAWIERNAVSRPIAFWPLKCDEVTVKLHEGQIWYDTKYGLIPAYDMIHVAGLGSDGITGLSPIRMQAEQLGITLRAQQFGADFFGNGATLGGLLTTDAKLTTDQRAQIKKAWYDNAHGSKNNHSTKILEGGLHYERVGIPPEEAQFLQTRKMGSEEICAMYRVPPHMVANLERSTFSNIEHQGIDFVKYTLLPWMERIEQEFNRKIYRESEVGKKYCAFNVNGLLKGDITAQTTHIQQMMDRGVYSINDSLRFLGQNTIGEEGSRRYMQRSMVPIDRVDDIIDNEQKQPTADTDGQGA